MSDYLNSGIIEAYVLGLATPSEVKEVEQMMVIHNEVHMAVEAFSKSLEQQAFRTKVIPDPIIKPMVLATINYISRLKNGEPFAFPPMLTDYSQISDYSEWLQREDFQIDNKADDVFARIISHTPEVTTAVVLIKNLAPSEQHNKEIEKFLIVEGSCEIIIEQEVYPLKPGDFFEIPLFKSHMVKVTSDIRCKVILQRVAA